MRGWRGPSSHLEALALPPSAARRSRRAGSLRRRPRSVTGRNSRDGADHPDPGDDVATAITRAQAHLIARQDARRLVEGRAAHQRHDGRRRPAAAAIPGHPAATTSSPRRRAGSARSNAPTAPGPTSRAGQATCRPPIEAYAALRLAGDDVGAPHMAAARAFMLASGGIEASRVFTRIWLALFGEWSWDDLPTMPPELVLLPKWFPLNVYDWGCWARQTVVRDHRGRPPCARCARCRSRWPNCASGVAARAGQDRPGRDRASTCSTRRSSSTTARRSSPAGRWRSARRRVGARAPRGRRRVGRHPAAVGLLDPGAAPARLPARRTRRWSRRSRASTGS